MPMLPPEGDRICELMPTSSPRGVHERAAGVALVDRRIGLQEVFVAAIAEARRAALGADDTHRHRLADAERVANREHDVADAHRVRVADWHDRQAAAVDLDTARSLGGSAPINFASITRRSDSST